MNLIIQEYFNQIELRLLENPIYEDYSILRKDLLYNEAKIRILINLTNGDSMELFEYLEDNMGKLESKKCSFHWQSKNRKLKLRWDNAPHHKELDNYPHHIHFEENRIKPNTFSPNILDFLTEVDNY
ncbi:MAG: hypothetical protein GXO89_16110 [Chlorobi bacterium]|nr:hypothetical protein [Chlorobiota bacterium]